MKKNYILFFIALLFAFSVEAQTTLSQSIDPVNVTDGGVACWSAGTGEYRENTFYRAYNLADFGISEDFEITSVEYAQGSADDNKLITLNIYTATSDDLSTATLTLIGSATHTSSAADDLSLISVALSATIPSGSTIAFEVLAGDSGTNTGETFFPGFNAAGENDDSYIKAEGCSINVPTPLSGISPSDQYVMNVVGNILAVDEFTLNSISISPNPTVDFINLDLPSNMSDFSTELYSVTGQLVLKSENQTNIDISEFNSGIYILKITSDNVSISRKIVKN